MRQMNLAAVLGLTLTLASAEGPLHVLRFSPTTPADRYGPVVVTFDRPVAGGLGTTVEAASIFRIEPAVGGTVRWRDPVSLVFEPEAAFDPGATYRVTIGGDFEAMDGSRLERPAVHVFRVGATAVLAGYPVGSQLQPEHVTSHPVFSVAVSAPVDPEAVARVSRIEVGESCGGYVVPLRGVGERPVGEDDHFSIRYAGWQLAGREDDPRRVVELTPTLSLPSDCPAELVVPERLESGSPEQRWSFRTHGRLTLDAVGCGSGRGACPTGPTRVEFSTPVRGSEVLRHVRVVPDVDFTVRDTTAESDVWYLQGTLRPRDSWAVVVDPMLEDVFGQRFTGTNVRAFPTTGYAPAATYEHGRLLVERNGLGTLAVQHINVDTLIVATLAVPDSMEGEVLRSTVGFGSVWGDLSAGVDTTILAVESEQDVHRLTGVPLTPADSGSGPGTLRLVRVSSPQLDSADQRRRPVAVVQVTNLGVHGRVGADQAQVWVTGVDDGLPRAGARVTIHDRDGRVQARGVTDAEGLVTVQLAPPEEPCTDWQCQSYDGYIAAELDGDRAIIGAGVYDSDLGAWRFGLWPARGTSRDPLAAAVFTERGIYRPGEPLYAKAIVRAGPLGSLRAPADDSMRWVFRDRENGIMEEGVVALSPFGTADRRIDLAASLPLGQYAVEAQLYRDGAWQTYATAGYEVAEYRPPEFLVDLTTGDGARIAGDTVRALVSGRYLFGAPMAGAPVGWRAVRDPVSPWEIDIPGAEDWHVGVARSWWEDGGSSGPAMLLEGADSLDDTGRLGLEVATPVPDDGTPFRLQLSAVVTDANRQTVTGGASLMVHPAAFYLAARQTGHEWFWTAGEPVTVNALALRPDGRRVEGVRIEGALVRREWHQVRRTRNGLTTRVGGWVQDTVATCSVRSASEPVSCEFTPPEGGSYTVALTAEDGSGRPVATTFHRWAAGVGWVPWNDEGQLAIDLIADRERYDVGDTATIMVASPFTGVEAWVTVERERVLETRRIRIEDGATTLRLPIDEGFAPNVFVSVVMVRGRSAPPGPIDDPGRPTMRVGYTELKVTPSVKRLAVEVEPERPEYRPGDSARVRVAVRDSRGQGRRAEVTLWAVDEGVLALTGYRTPEPVDLIYPPRGLAMRLGSNLVAVAAQVPEGQKGGREPGGGGGDLAAILRSRFQTTAFFLGSVVTDAEGRATAAAELPDNLTTFRVMAVAVTEGDRYGSGESGLLVSRPLLARPALPRFVRPGDRFDAGTVVNSRLPRAVEARVDADVSGIELAHRTSRDVRIEPLRPTDVRFDFRAVEGDTARFRFVVRGGGEADAVETRVPVEPRAYPLVRTITGVLHDTAAAVFEVDDDIDPGESRLEISFGSSPLAFIGGAALRLRVYPYYCSEQVGSAALPLIALHRARARIGEAVSADSEEQIRSALSTLERRQRPDGGIGYWSQSDWTSPTLTAYAGRVLLEASEAGFSVPDTVLELVGDYLENSLTGAARSRTAVAERWSSPTQELSERVAAADLLSRLGRPAVAAENSLLQNAGRLSWEDRVLLAQLFARRGEMVAARRLLDLAMANLRVDGRVLTVPDTVTGHAYFRARSRPVARLLEALLLVDPDHRFVGPAVERLVAGGRVASRSWWNTFDLGHAVLALVDYDERVQSAEPTEVAIEAPGRTLELRARVGVSDTILGLGDLAAGEAATLPLRLVSRDGPPVFYYLTLRAMPAAEHPEPLDRGIGVERWYEDADTGEPVVAAAEGQLVRVRVRVTVPAERTFVVVDDPLPAGLEPVDLSLRTVSPFGAGASPLEELRSSGWTYGSWDAGMWSPFDHKEMRDDRVVYSATVLWSGSYDMAYLARATTAGEFLFPPAHAEEMYNPGVNGRSGGGTFTVTRSSP